MYKDVSIPNITSTKEGIHAYPDVWKHTTIISYVSYYTYGLIG